MNDLSAQTAQMSQRNEGQKLSQSFFGPQAQSSFANDETPATASLF